MFLTKPYYTTETAVRVRSDFWFESAENRNLIYRTAVSINADPEHPRSNPLTIFVMEKDDCGCLGFFDIATDTMTPRLAKLMAVEGMADAA
ncbi:MAG: hypothetical protein NXH88_10095 [Hyphomonas sp.]|nr:hypothetical protein [Hyphomonas sp.]